MHNILPAAAFKQHMTEYKKASRDEYLQRLRSKELIDIVPGGVRASETLFESGAWKYDA